MRLNDQTKESAKMAWSSGRNGGAVAAEKSIGGLLFYEQKRAWRKCKRLLIYMHFKKNMYTFIRIIFTFLKYVILKS